MWKRNRHSSVKLWIEKPSSLSQLDELLDLGLERVDLDPTAGSAVLKLTFTSNTAETEGDLKFRLAAACTGANLAVLEPNAAGEHDEDELLDRRAW